MIVPGVAFTNEGRNWKVRHSIPVRLLQVNGSRDLLAVEIGTTAIFDQRGLWV